MKKLISAASALAMAASMVGAAVPFATGAADASKGFELRAFTNKAGETVSTTISEDAIKAGDVTIPIGVYFLEGTADSQSIACQWTVDSKDGDASNTNVVFTGYVPGEAYFDNATTVTLNDGSSGNLSCIVGFCGTVVSNKRGDSFKETKAGTYNCAEKQTSWGCPNSWGSVTWLAPVSGGYKWSGKTSDEYPMFVFEATFKKGTPAGTYSINFLDKEDDKKVQATMVEGPNGTRYAIPNNNLTVKGIDIVIGGSGEGTTASTSASTSASTTAATTAATTASTPATTEQQPQDGYEIAKDFIVKGTDYTAKPGDELEVEFIVENPGNHLGATFVAELGDLPAGITAEMTDTACYAIDEKHGAKDYEDLGGSYQVHVTDKTTQDPSEVLDGEAIICFTFKIPSDIAPGQYSYSLKKFRVVEHAQVPVVKFDATLKPGTITIEGEGGTTASTSASTSASTTEKTTESTTAKTTETTTAKTTESTTASKETSTAKPGDPVYGDTNCDGKVNIADVVLLNKWLNDAKSYDITAQGKLNADCCDAKGGEGLDKNDSDAIIRKIVHLVELPCASAELK